MFKFIGGIVVGVFVGALAIEVLERSRPELMAKVREKANRVKDRAFGTREYVEDMWRSRGAGGADAAY